MDYLKLLRGLEKEFFEAGKAKYESLFIVWKILLTIIFIPVRVGFFFARLGYWFTWFFFKCLATPVEYLQKWLDKQQDGIHQGKALIVDFLHMLNGHCSHLQSGRRKPVTGATARRPATGVLLRSETGN